MTPDKKYSVFVSSTFRDLRKPRDTVMRALLRMNCIPEGMELFVAGSQSQWETIRNTIDKCDCCVVIVGGRYGTIVLDAIARNPDGVSYTEMEYRHAKARGIPVLAFLHEKPESLLVGEKEKDGETDEKRGKLRQFRSVLETETTAAHWETPDQLQAEICACLPPILAKSGRWSGWVRGRVVLSTRDELRKETDEKISDMERRSAERTSRMLREEKEAEYRMKEVGMR